MEKERDEISGAAAAASSFFFFFLAVPQHVGVPGPGIEPEPHQLQSQILNQ